LQPLF